jgi:hypothetical protein
MDPKSRLNHRENEDLTPQQQSQGQQGREFASPEELLRFDAAQTPVPSGIENKLQQWVVSEPKPPARSWWRKLLGL